MSKPVAIDLFSGAGGLSCGLEMAGVDVLAGLEFNPVAKRSFLLNHFHPDRGKPAGFLEPVDISQVGPEDVRRELGRGPEEIDIVTGGPPCQGFSTAGERRTKDIRNTLVFDFARMVRELRPRYFLMENVVGLLSMKTPGGRPVLEALAEEFADAGYQTNVPVKQSSYKSLVVNAADHGVPQLRRRVLVFGSRDGAVPRLRPPSHHAAGCLPFGDGVVPYVSVAEALDDLPSPSRDEPAKLPRKRSLSDFARLMRISARGLWNHTPTRHKPFMVERMQKQAVGTPLYDTWAHAWVRLVPDQPSPTVKENHNAPFVHHREPRVTTPRECARLQSFPDRFRFEGPKSKQLVQIGNAIPPLLGRAIGHAFLDALAGRTGPTGRPAEDGVLQGAPTSPR